MRVKLNSLNQQLWRDSDPNVAQTHRMLHLFLTNENTTNETRLFLLQEMVFVFVPLDPIMIFILNNEKRVWDFRIKSLLNQEVETYLTSPTTYKNWLSQHFGQDLTLDP